MIDTFNKRIFGPFQDYQFIILIAIFLLLTGNISFYSRLLAVYPLQANAGFILSVSVLLTSVFIFITGIFSLALPTRPLLTFTLIIAALAGHYSDTFGTIMDVEMIRNTFETNAEEARDLLSINLLVRLLILAVIPVYWVWNLPYQTHSWIHSKRKILVTSAMAFGVMVTCILPFSDQYSSFFRQHKLVRYYTNPSYPLWSVGKFIHESLASPKSNTLILLNANPKIIELGEAKELIILVVGETARADHFSLNGYPKDTNPELINESNLISYKNFSACGTSTAISVPCMFAYANQNLFDVSTSKNTENVLDLLVQAGVNILWRDNNSSSKGVADRVTYQDYRSPATNSVCDSECRDIGMLVGLQDYIDTHSGDILIVLHQMGSHGPAYYKRYPKNFEHFSPACQSAELQDCSKEEITNAYDNSLRYTDYFLSQTISLLKDNTPKYETAMLYISDHGESLGESGIFLHGMPYRFAPDAQTKVPLIAWIGESSDIDYNSSLIFKSEPTSHDAIFDTLLDLFEVRTELPPAAPLKFLVLKDSHDAS